MIVRVTELAVSLDRTLLGNDRLGLRVTHRAQHIHDPLARATAAEGYRLRIVDAQVLFVKQPAQQFQWRNAQ